MKIASVIGGYSLGEADILRRAMGKKKAEVMAEQSKIFVEKSTKQGFDAKKAQALFDLMAYFAGYGFNKSHSAAYALIAYQTAYLKANYPAEFMACLITLESTNTESMSFYLSEAKDLGIEILPPDINKSEIHFSVVNGKILFGLQGIKNVGLASLENIIAQRIKKPFIDLLDFCTRIDLRTSNKRVLENLICAGALDSLPGNRAQKHNELQKIIELATEKKQSALTGQMGLFAVKSSENMESIEYYSYQMAQEWSDKEKLEKEKDVMGFYLSSHPLDTYKIVKWLNINSFESSLEKVKNCLPEDEIIITGCGIKKTQKNIVTKNGENMAFLQIEDKTSTAEIIIFPKLYKKVETFLETHTAFIVKGSLDTISTNKCKIKASNLIPLELFFEQWPIIDQISLDLNDSISQEKVNSVISMFKKGKTKLNIIFKENGKKLSLKTNHNVSFDSALLQQIQEQNIRIKLNV